MGFQNFIQEPKETEAMNEMFQAQSYYEQALTATTKDSLFNLSLNGGNGKFGFVDIIDNYSGTNAANLANYYAGVAYLNTGKYLEAIKHLDQFKADDANVAPIAKGAIGDAFAQLDQQEEALKYYENAVLMSSSELTAPRFLLKAGINTAANLITALPSDADNLFVVLTANQLNKKCKIISRASDESSYSKLKIAGANNVIMPDKLGGDHMASLVVTPDVIEFVDRLTIEGETTANLEEI